MANFNAKKYWEERHVRQYGPESVGYIGLGVPFNNWMYRVRGKVVERIVAKAGIEVRNSDVLDIGSGTGFYIALWSRLGARSVSGSDFSPYAVAALQKSFPGRRLMELDIAGEALPPDLGQFDVVSAFDILYHIVADDRYRRAIANIKSLVRPGGHFIFSENFMPKARVGVIHQVSRSESEITALLNENGFEFVLRAPMFYLMNRPVRKTNAFLDLNWRVIERITRIRWRPYLGNWLGAMLYPIELVCVRAMASGPSTEMMVCQLRK